MEQKLTHEIKTTTVTVTTIQCSSTQSVQATSDSHPSAFRAPEILPEAEYGFRQKIVQTEENSNELVRSIMQPDKNLTKMSKSDIKSSSPTAQVKRTSVICAVRQEEKTQSLKSEAEELKSSNLKPLSSCQKISECPICCEVCVNHLHYGGISCYSCKAFFRRSVTAPSRKTKSCRRGDGKCSLKLHCRNNCPFCRLKKCLENEMKPQLVLSNRTADRPVLEAPSSSNDNFPSGLILCMDNQHDLSPDSPTSSISLSTTIEDILLFKVLETHLLILSQTASVNLLSIPTHFTREVEKRIKEVENSQEFVNQDILLIAQMELAFLVAKEYVSFFTEHVTMDKLIRSQEEGVNPALVFTSIQVNAALFCFLWYLFCFVFFAILDLLERISNDRILPIA